MPSSFPAPPELTLISANRIQHRSKNRHNRSKALKFFELRTFFELTMYKAKQCDICSQRGDMATFDRVEHKRTGIRTQTETDRRLSPGQSIIVIAVLSALSWGVLIAGALGIRALL